MADKTQNVFYNFVGYMSNMDNDNIRDEVIGNVIVFTWETKLLRFHWTAEFLFYSAKNRVVLCICDVFSLLSNFKMHASWNVINTLPWHSSKYFKHCHQLSTWRYTRMARPSMLRSATWTPAEKNERNQIVEHSSFWMTGNLQSPFS